MSYENFDTFRQYNEFYSKFLNRIEYRKKEINRRRVHRTILQELNWAFDEFFITERTNEKLSTYYECFTEQEIKFLKLDFIRSELDALQTKKQRFDSSYIFKPIERLPFINSKINHPTYAGTKFEKEFGSPKLGESIKLTEIQV